MKVKYHNYSHTPDEIEVDDNEFNNNDETIDELSDRFLYGYLIICGVIITVLKIFE